MCNTDDGGGGGVCDISFNNDAMRGRTEVRPSKDKRGFDLISDALPFGRLWYAGPNAISNAVSFAKFYSRSHHAVISVYDEAGNSPAGCKQSNGCRDDNHRDKQHD